MMPHLHGKFQVDSNSLTNAQTLNIIYLMDKFVDAARSFYETAYNYYRKWLPLNDPFLKHCQFVNFVERLEHGIEDVI